jgi:hypothetical protein
LRFCYQTTRRGAQKLSLRRLTFQVTAYARARGTLINGFRSCSAHSSRFRPDHAARRLVGSATRRIHNFGQLPGLCDMGRLSEQVLRFRQLPVAVLLSVAILGFSARVDPRQSTFLDSLIFAVFSGPLDSAVPRGFQIDVLLL